METSVKSCTDVNQPDLSSARHSLVLKGQPCFKRTWVPIISNSCFVQRSPLYTTQQRSIAKDFQISIWISVILNRSPVRVQVIRLADGNRQAGGHWWRWSKGQTAEMGLHLPGLLGSPWDDWNPKGGTEHACVSQKGNMSQEPTQLSVPVPDSSEESWS